MSERHACRLVSQPRGTQRYQPTARADEERLTEAIVALASEYGRYGYRRSTILIESGPNSMYPQRFMTLDNTARDEMMKGG